MRDQDSCKQKLTSAASLSDITKYKREVISTVMQVPGIEKAFAVYQASPWFLAFILESMRSIMGIQEFSKICTTFTAGEHVWMYGGCTPEIFLNKRTWEFPSRIPF